MGNKKLDMLGVSAFCESMAMMVQSGIQTEEAVALLRQEDQKEAGLLEQALALMQAELENGGSLSGAMEKSGAFPAYALKMVAAGEGSGRLEAVLFQLSRYYAKQKTLSQKLRNTVTYPAVMLVLIIVVLALMLTMVLPAFTQVYNRLTGSLADSSYGYIRWSYGFCWGALGVMVLLSGALLLGLALWNSKNRRAVEGVLYKLPVCGELLRQLGLYRFTAALSTFLASGELQDLAVAESKEMTACKPIEEKLSRCQAHLEEGHSIAQAAFEEKLYEPVYGRMLLAGERSGKLEEILRQIEGLLEEHCTSLADRLTGILDPLLSGVMLVTVGVSLLSVMLPLLGIMSSIG